MQAETCEVIIYTSGAVISFDIIITANDFQERLAAALEDGTVILDTAEGSKLVLNAINVVAIEVRESKSSSNTPPVKNI